MSETKEVKQEAGIGLTAEQLKDILAAAIAAGKAPNAVEQAKLDQEAAQMRQANEGRLRNAESIKEQAESKLRLQKEICSHEHATGQSHGVFIQEKNGYGYILCQLCQGIIRPGVAPTNYKGTAIYNNQLFNRLFQKLQATAGDIIL